jgi:hypothetical protein
MDDFIVDDNGKNDWEPYPEDEIPDTTELDEPPDWANDH